jgi:uncharacterized protein
MSGSGSTSGAAAADVMPRAAGRPSRPARILLAAVRGYQVWISPVLPPSCRFEPSCSAYAVEALTEHGALRGFWLTVRRLLRCGPWHPGGWDPVPPRHTSRRSAGSGIPGPARLTAAEE